jgi:GntR family transcriptional regulator
MVKQMNINLDYKSRTPIYEQIIEEIERYVALKILTPGEQIPSIRDMACSLGINPNTVKKAYSILEGKNVIQTISTKGTFIADNIEDVIIQKKKTIEEQIEKNIIELEKLGVSKKEIKEDLIKRGVL